MMILHNKTLKSAVWYTASNVIAKAITLLITPVFTRLLTKAEYGDYTTFVSWQNILLTVFSLELSSTVLRAKFDREKDEEFNSYVFTISWFSIIAVIVLCGLLMIANFNPLINSIIGIDISFMWMLCFILVFSPILQIYQAQQRAEVRYKTSSIITIIYGVSSFLLPYVFIKISNNALQSLLFGLTINTVCWGVGLLVFISSRRKNRVNLKDIQYALVFSLPIVPHLVSSIIMGNSDKIMIRNMCGSEYAAIYGLVYTCSLAITLLRNSLNNAWLPWFYRKMNEKKYSDIKQVSRFFIVYFSLGSLLICLLGPEIIKILGGSNYIEAVGLIPIIMVACYYNFLNLFYINIEFYNKKTIMISAATICTAILNLILNYVFIKKYGYSAAAYTTAFCNLIIVLIHYIVTRDMDNVKVCNNIMIFIASLVSFIVILFCVLVYKNLLLRIVSIAILCIFTFFYTISLKRKGMLKP